MLAGRRSSGSGYDFKNAELQQKYEKFISDLNKSSNTKSISTLPHGFASQLNTPFAAMKTPNLFERKFVVNGDVDFIEGNISSLCNMEPSEADKFSLSLLSSLKLKYNTTENTSLVCDFMGDYFTFIKRIIGTDLQAANRKMQISPISECQFSLDATFVYSIDVFPRIQRSYIYGVNRVDFIFYRAPTIVSHMVQNDSFGCFIDKALGIYYVHDTVNQYLRSENTILILVRVDSRFYNITEENEIEEYVTSRLKAYRTEYPIMYRTKIRYQGGSYYNPDSIFGLDALKAILLLFALK